jgi:membrane protease YdiL (CAAX protease family)
VLRAAGYVGLFLLAQLIAGGALALAGLSPKEVSGDDVELRDVVMLCLLEALVLMGAVWCAWVRGWASLGLQLRGRAQARGWWQLAPVGVLVIGPSLAAAALDDPGTIISHMSASTFVVFIVLAVLIAVAEELWFRGLVMAALDPVRSPWLAVVASSILFGLPHVLSSDAGVTAATALNAAAVTLAIAIPFACVRVASRAILPMIGWHSVIDAWAFLHTASITAEGTPDIAEASVALIIPALVSLGYLSWLHRQKRGRTQSTQ